MKWLPILLLLVGCSQVPFREDLSQQLHARMEHDISYFNHLRETNVPYPEIRFSSLSDSYAEADSGVITIDPNRCEQNFNDCLNETLPHEEAHIIVQAIYGKVITTKIISINGVPQQVKEIDSAGHNFEWCDVAHVLGAHPEKDGYCH